MQPYFLPYPGYYQTVGSVDTWVIFDDVQFPRRGWVHRNRFLTRSGTEHWGTLELRRAQREASIASMVLARPGHSQLDSLRSRFPSIDNLATAIPAVEHAFSNARLSQLLVYLNTSVLDHLGMDVSMILSSEIAYDRSGTAQEKILSICERLQADVYVNPSGGRDLYDADVFARQGIELRFAREYTEFRLSIAEWLMTVS